MSTSLALLKILLFFIMLGLHSCVGLVKPSRSGNNLIVEFYQGELRISSLSSAYQTRVLSSNVSGDTLVVRVKSGVLLRPQDTVPIAGTPPRYVRCNGIYFKYDQGKFLALAP